MRAFRVGAVVLVCQHDPRTDRERHHDLVNARVERDRVARKHHVVRPQARRPRLRHAVCRQRDVLDLDPLGRPVDPDVNMT